MRTLLMRWFFKCKRSLLCHILLLLTLQVSNLGLSNVNFHMAVEKIFVELCAMTPPNLPIVI